MSMKELVVCKFKGCKRVYDDPRILPCGKRTCAEHITTMTMKNDDNNLNDSDDLDSASRKRIKCDLCGEMHNFPENGKEFPVDEHIPLLLSMKLCSEHESAKKSFNEVSQLIEKLTKFDKEKYVIDYFERVETDILLEKEVNMQKLLAYYQKLVDDVHERKVKCLSTLKTNKSVDNVFAYVMREFADLKSKLNNDKMGFILKTLDGDEAKWKEIQSASHKLLERTKVLEEELEENLIASQMSIFIAKTSIQCELVCGRLDKRLIDSKILGSNKMIKEIVKVCQAREFKLLYRARRDGFEASSFHAKCDNQPRTLTIVRALYGYIFGAYTSVAWDSTSGYKIDPNAFIFSYENCVNPSSPRLIPIKDGDKSSIYGDAAYGPTFGGGHDIHIADRSNETTKSYSNLGQSFDFKLFQFGTHEAHSFLAGFHNFKTDEIEVFQLN